MHITKARIENYKSFLDSGDIEFKPGFNIIVGQNDAGKSALIESISLTAMSKPHRSTANILHVLASPKPHSQTHLTVTLSPKDLTEHLSSHQSYIINLDQQVANNNPADFLNNAFSSPLAFETTWTNGGATQKILPLGFRSEFRQSIGIRNDGYPSHLRFESGSAGGEAVSLIEVLAQALYSSIYAFKAERFPTRPFQPRGEIVLATDSSNLAEVLTQLAASNPHRFKRLTAHLIEIFPHITAVTAKIQQSVATVHVWSEPPELEREDLAVPLADSGTGISHVLAILYVVVTSNVSRIIMIDEPQSYLHPGAARKLFELLRQYPQHQYIVATHVPPLLGEDDAVFIARREGPVTKIAALDTKSQKAISDFLTEVGARLSDVFGADSILWVEGKTEELCFPIVLRSLTNRGLAGVQLLSLIQTGDLNKRDASRIFSIYSSLSRGPTLMPRALAFILDDEGRSAQEKIDLEKLSVGLLRWLPRRMFENYLLDSEAIAYAINESQIKNQPVTAEIISAWLCKNDKDLKFWKNGYSPQNYPTADWFKLVHGAEVLKAVFAEFCAPGINYEKVHHGQVLTKFLCSKKSADMYSLADFITPFLSK